MAGDWSSCTYFTFWRDCRTERRSVVTGDARLRLGDSADGRYGMLVVDAFSSSAIPVHLAPEEREAGKDPSQWVVLAHTRSGLGALADDPRWLALTARAGARVWTDDFSNPWRVIRLE